MGKTFKSISGLALTVLASVAPVANVLAWGDSNGGRSGYTMGQVDGGVLGNSVVLNSITDGQYHDASGNLHQLGDERNFVRTRLAGTTNSWNADSIVAEDGKEYTISMYIHNDNPSSSVVAKDVTAIYSIPGNSDTSIEVNGYITSSNANPTKYWDNVKFTSADGTKFHLEYVAGSALWESNGASAGALSDNIITTSGVKVGFASLNGDLPGSYYNSGYASVKVRVVYDQGFTLTNQVRLKGTTTWSTQVNANVGDTVEYMIGYKNISGATVYDVMLQDSLPTNMQYVPGSTKLKNANHPTAVTITSDTLTTTGINLGGYTNNSNAYVLFEAKVVNVNLQEGTTNLVNWAKITAGGITKLLDSSVLVKIGDGGHVNPPDTPVTPSDLPDTGPADVLVSALGAGSLVTVLGYFIASRKKM